MKRWLIISVLALASLGLAAVASGTPGHGHGHGTWHRTFTVTTADHGCSFRVWATDHLKRTFTVRQNHNGSYRVTRQYTAQRHHHQHLRRHHWVDRGLNGVNETFIGDIATS